jgi:hypothetical protein
MNSPHSPTWLLRKICGCTLTEHTARPQRYVIAAAKHSAAWTVPIRL